MFKLSAFRWVFLASASANVFFAGLDRDVTEAVAWIIVMTYIVSRGQR